MRQVSYRTGAATAVARAVASAASGRAKSVTRRASGSSIEKLFQQTHETYAAQRRAVIVHLHPPVAGTPGNLRYSGGGHIDYMGVLEHAGHGNSQGTAIAFDVKGVTGHATFHVPKDLPITHKRHAQSVRDRKRLLDQASLLTRFGSAGGLAAFLLVDTKLEKCWIMDQPERTMRGEDVTFRDRTGDLFPSVPFATIEQIALGAPMIDYLSTWLYQ
jgi:hypothetical protein